MIILSREDAKRTLIKFIKHNKLCKSQYYISRNKYYYYKKVIKFSYIYDTLCLITICKDCILSDVPKLQFIS